MNKILFVICTLCMYIFASAQHQQLIDIWHGSQSSSPYNLIQWNGSLFLYANDSATGLGLKKYNTVSGTTNICLYQEPIYDYDHGNLCAVFNNKLYFAGYDTSTGIELYEYNGVSLPTRAFDINPGIISSTPQHFTVCGNNLYFRASGPTGTQLYCYDGKKQPFPIFLRTNPPSDFIMSFIRAITYNGLLYFSADYWDSNERNFCINPANNVILDLHNIFPVYRPMNNPIIVGSDLYFSDFGAAGLCSYDGKNPSIEWVGTSSKYVKCIGNGGMAAYKGGIFFCGSSEATKTTSLYRSDMITRVLTTVTPIIGYNARYPATEMLAITTFNGLLYFSAAIDSFAGTELYSYDGNSVNLVADINPFGSSNPEEFAVLNGELYCVAYNMATGRELYCLGKGGVGVQNISWHGKVTLYPNPTTVGTTLQITLKDAEKLTVRINDILGKEVFSTGSLLFNSGQNEIALPVRNFIAGQYCYRISDKDSRIVAAGTLQKL